MSGQVKSQTMVRPFAQGSTVKPSGRLPSSLDNEFGFSIDGTLADARARLIRSLLTGGLATRQAVKTRAVDLLSTDKLVWGAH